MAEAARGAPDDPSLSHVDAAGRARMVDVGDKDVSERAAVAEGRVLMQAGTAALIADNALRKGDLLATAELAGVMAAKRTHELIPLCHPLALSHVSVECALEAEAETPPGFGGAVAIRARVRCRGRTGVEMEALTAVSVAALTVYDMAKAVDRGMRITDVRLREKSGGRSGEIRLE
ncbi:MAG: cyclic pyranopterin monophosphate synthase MoaC [Chloroflexi bacterium]|nr:cyclic pyranopterin monophosphate synthase MoaC [Chloroflexota bacterium]